MVDPQTDTAHVEAALRERVATACRVLYKIGLADYMGHATNRVPGAERIVIKPRHSETIKGMDMLSAEQIIVIDLDGNLLEGTDIPAKEKYIHTQIYRARPDVGGVVHTHRTWATIFGTVGRDILPILHVESVLVKRGIPLYPSPDLIVNPALGDAVAEVLGDHPVMHLQGHGIVTVAATVEEATIAAIQLERLARANYYAAQLGTPRVVSPASIDQLAASIENYHVRWAYYASLANQDGLVINW